MIAREVDTEKASLSSYSLSKILIYRHGPMALDPRDSSSMTPPLMPWQLGSLGSIPSVPQETERRFREPAPPGIATSSDSFIWPPHRRSHSRRLDGSWSSLETKRWPRILGFVSVLLLCLSWAGSLTSPIPEIARGGQPILSSQGAGLVAPSILQPHWPIHITNSSGFNASNGVRHGSGTASDPYVISDWLFNGSSYPLSTAMVRIENTDQHVIVQNCQVTHFDSTHQFDAFYVGKYPGEVTTPTIAPPLIDLTSNVTFLNNDIESHHGYGIEIAEGSSHILVRGNRVDVHPDSVIGANYTYGINVARNTHAVTVENNIVDAASSRYITIGIHLSDYYVSEQRRASGLVARNNTVIDASGGIHVESSRSTLVEGNTVYQTTLNSRAAGWPRAITLRESALNARIVNNTIRVEAIGIVIGASTLGWNDYGPIVGASNATLQDNTISETDTGIAIGNVSGARIVHATFMNVARCELDLREENGPPGSLTITDVATPIRVRSPAATVLVRWSWTSLTGGASYRLTGSTGTTTFNASFGTSSAGAGSVVGWQPQTTGTLVTRYTLAGPPPSGPPVDLAGLLAVFETPFAVAVVVAVTAGTVLLAAQIGRAHV